LALANQEVVILDLCSNATASDTIEIGNGCDLYFLFLSSPNNRLGERMFALLEQQHDGSPFTTAPTFIMLLSRTSNMPTGSASNLRKQPSLQK